MEKTLAFRVSRVIPYEEGEMDGCEREKRRGQRVVTKTFKERKANWHNKKFIGWSTDFSVLLAYLASSWLPAVSENSAWTSI